MASILIAPLTDIFTEEALATLAEKLQQWEISLRPQGEELDQGVENDLDDEILSDFMNDLEDEYEQADVYIPGEFPNIITIDDIRVGSLEGLIEALESLQDNLGIDDPEGSYDEEEEFNYDDDETDFMDRMEFSRLGVKSIWYDMYRIANAALELESNVILHKK